MLLHITIAAAFMTFLSQLTFATPIESENQLAKRVCYAYLPAGKCTVQLQVPRGNPPGSLTMTVFDNTCSHELAYVTKPAHGKSYALENGGNIVLHSMKFPRNFPISGRPSKGAKTSFTVNKKTYTQRDCDCRIEHDYGYNSNSCSCKVAC